MDEHSAADRERIRAALNNLDAELLKMIDNLLEATETVELDQGQQGRLSRIDAMQAQKMVQILLSPAVPSLILNKFHRLQSGGEYLRVFP